MKIKNMLTRVYTEDIAAGVGLYEELTGCACALRFGYESAGLELAQVGEFLLLGGSREALAPFRETRVTLLVDSVAEFRTFLLGKGASLVRDVQDVPTGKNMTVRHPDGTVVEYVEFR